MIRKVGISMEEIINLLIYLAIGAGLVGIAWGGIYIKRKLNISDAEIELGKNIISVVDYIFQNGDIEYKGTVSIIIKYVKESIDFVDEYDNVVDIRQKKELVEDMALRLCENNGIKMSPELVGLVDNIINYFVK